ncbi:hypothetical protein [Aeromonas salmonicida]|uniref:hypothetical protein n=1 Tax=Aeromonas salmonicida TaxID=645 RepID=UPI000F771507|nr:hypothetical protein [Aeromonas salmonicida]RSM24952.1 hypothetical protein C5B77_19345 [Aeromonas salmonicida]
MFNPTISIKPHQLEKEVCSWPLSTIMGAIKAGHWADQIDAIRNAPDSDTKKQRKNRLPMFYSIKFLLQDSGASTKIPFHGTGLFIYDLDVYEDTQVQSAIDILMAKMKPYVSFYFRSPSGGLKFGIRTDVTDEDASLYKHSYKKLGSVLNKLGFDNAIGLDSQTCNINRGTYVSTDWNCYLNLECKALPLRDKANDSYQRIIKEKAEQIASQAYLNAGRNIDKEKAARLLNDKLDDIFMMATAPGSRNRASFDVCIQTYNHGFGVKEAIQNLWNMKNLGLYTEIISIEQRAADVLIYWVNNGSQLNKAIYERRKTFKLPWE